MKQEKIGRNAACPCGSGKKYKNCCGGAGVENKRSGSRLIVLLLGGLLALGAIGFVKSLTTSEPSEAPAGVWSAEHGHYH